MTTATATDRRTEKLVDYLQDAHSLKRHARTSLKSLMQTTSDPAVLAQLRRHMAETEKHERLMHDRLAAYGASPSMVGDVAAVTPALLKGVADQVRPDKQGKVGRDVYITENVEIAAFSLLERLARRFGDLETARAAALVRSEDEAAAGWVVGHWEHFIDLTLDDAGIDAPRTPGYTHHDAPSGLLAAATASPVLAAAGAVVAGVLAYSLLGSSSGSGSRSNRLTATGYGYGY